MLQLLVRFLLLGCLLGVTVDRAWGMSKGSPYKLVRKHGLARKKAKDKNPDLLAGVARTRRKIKCRDSDIIIVTYPKSGTHWISSVLSQIYYAPFGGHPSAPGTHTLPDIQLSNTFHQFPIYWLLPGTTDDNQILERSYEEIESAPPQIPRIFLSHMPVEYFEYSPTAHTRVIYMMRDPKAVWASMLNMLNRRIQVGTQFLKGADATKMNAMHTKGFVFDKHDIQTFTKDFITGDIKYPPRNADTGPMFAWNQHTLNWWNVISSKDPRYGSGTVIDYDAAIENPEQAVKDLMVFLNAFAINNASTIAKQASYQAVKDSMDDTQSRLKTFASAVHMPDKTQTKESQQVRGLFERFLTPAQREVFYESNSAHKLVKSHRHPATALVR